MQNAKFEANDEMLRTFSKDIGDFRKELDEKNAYIHMLK